MPIQIRQDVDRGILIAAFSQRVTVDDLRASMAAAVDIPGYLDGVPMLLDLSALTDVPVTKDWIELGRLLKEAPVPLGTRRAIVAPSDLYFGLSRMMQAYAEGAPARYDVFRTMDDALAALCPARGRGSAIVR